MPHRLRTALGTTLSACLILGAAACSSATTAQPGPVSTAAGTATAGTLAAATSTPSTPSPAGTSTGKSAPGRSTSGAASTAAPTPTSSSSALKPLPVATAQHAIPKDSAIKDTPSLRTAVLLTGCQKSASGWSAGGTAKNAAATAATFTVLVFFTDRYSRVIDSATTSISVRPKSTGSWTAEQKFDPPAGTQCVLRAVRKS